MEIKDILDYYSRRDELTFNQIMMLYLKGKLDLKRGFVSKKDLRTIVEECDVKPIDSRKISPEGNSEAQEHSDAHPYQELDIDTTYKRRDELEHARYTLDKKLNKAIRKARKKNTKNDRNILKKLEEVVDTNICLAELEKHLFHIDKLEDDSNNTAYLERAILHRKRAVESCNTAKDVCTYPNSIKEYRKVADNLLAIGELKFSLKDSDSSLKYIEKAKECFKTILKKIRNTESRLRAEENAKIGTIRLLMYKITNSKEHLDEARNLLSEYDSHNPDSVYSEKLFEVWELEDVMQHD